MISKDLVDKEIDDVISKLKQYDFLHIMKSLFRRHILARKLRDMESEILALTIRYIQSVYCSLPYSPGSKKISETDLSELVEQVGKLIYMSSRASRTDTGLKNFDYRKLYDEYSGKMYPWLAVHILDQMLAPQENLLQSVYDTPDIQFKNGIFKIVSILEEAARTVLKNDTIEDIDSLLPDDAFSLTRIGWPRAFLDDVSFHNGQESTFFNREQYRGWPHIEMPTAKRPFVKVRDNHFIFDFNTCFDSIYRSIHQAIMSKNNYYGEEWRVNQTIASEQFVAKSFSKLLPDARCYTNNFYTLKGKQYENDGLLLFENVLIVFEVKGGSYTWRSVETDSKSHERSAKDLIEKPLGQSKRLIQALKETEYLEIFDENKESIVSLRKENIQYFFPVSVTLEPIGDITASYTTVNPRPDFKDCISLTLHDLVAYAFFFESPLFFLHFFKERAKSIDIECSIITDEMSYLGAYLETRHFNSRMNNILEDVTDMSKIGAVYHDTSSAVNNFFESRGERPKFDVSPTLYDIIKSLDKGKGTDRIGLAFNILDSDLDLDGLTKLDDIIEKIIKRQKNRMHFSSVILLESNPEMIPIQIFCNTETEKFVTYEKARLYSAAYHMVLGFEKLFSLILEVEGGNVVHAHCELITENTKHTFDNPHEFMTIVEQVRRTVS